MLGLRGRQQFGEVSVFLTTVAFLNLEAVSTDGHAVSSGLCHRSLKLACQGSVLAVRKFHRLEGGPSSETSSVLGGK